MSISVYLIILITCYNFVIQISQSSPSSLVIQSSANNVIMLRSTSLNYSDVQCASSRFYCKDRQTCCKIMNDDVYSCCPFTNGFCCKNGLACCPRDYTCSPDSQECYSQDKLRNNISDTSSVLVEGVKLEYNFCPGGSASCPDDATCCVGASGSYSCCPGRNAVCCSDGLHCCKSGSKCSNDGKRCVINDVSNSALDREPSGKETQSVNRWCPDKMTYCNANYTCCRLINSWGCCPAKDAVCCADKLHCCPHGYVCTNDSCIDKHFTKELSLNRFTVSCPDRITKCDHDEICVSLFNNQLYSCLKKTKMEKFISNLSKRTDCSDNITFCRNGDTCCFSNQNQSSCCPLVKGVCCGGVGVGYCCPFGHTCDIQNRRCVNGDRFLPITLVEAIRGREKLRVMLQNKRCCKSGLCCNGNGELCNEMTNKCLREKVEVICPGGNISCDEGFTCCKTIIGKWGCCPFKNAICCKDNLHCCPEAHTCNIEENKCDPTTIKMRKSCCKSGVCCNKAGEDCNEENNECAPTPWRQHHNDIVCRDGKSTCNANQTCCLLSNGRWGCCPFVNAVCCSDQKNCCPAGYTCNSIFNECEHRTNTSNKYGGIPMKKKQSAHNIMNKDQTAKV